MDIQNGYDIVQLEWNRVVSWNLPWLVMLLDDET